MRVLWTDYVKKYAASIDSLFGQEGYPASNVASQFLNSLFISIFQADTVTIQLDQDRSISAVYVAGCNCAKFTVEIKNAGGSTVYGPTEHDNLTSVQAVYFDAVDGRDILVSADINADGLAPFVDTEMDSGDNLKIKGIGAGSPQDLKDGILSSFGLPAITNTRATVSASGQITSTKLPVLATRSWEFDNYTYADVMAAQSNFEKLNIQNPTYFDPFDEATGDYEQPRYMALTDTLSIQRLSGRDFGRYRFTMILQEAR